VTGVSPGAAGEHHVDLGLAVGAAAGGEAAIGERNAEKVDGARAEPRVAHRSDEPEVLHPRTAHNCGRQPTTQEGVDVPRADLPEPAPGVRGEEAELHRVHLPVTTS
jgi:hypothetical protein